MIMIMMMIKMMMNDDDYNDDDVDDSPGRSHRVSGRRGQSPGQSKVWKRPSFTLYHFYSLLGPVISVIFSPTPTPSHTRHKVFKFV